MLLRLLLLSLGRFIILYVSIIGYSYAFNSKRCDQYINGRAGGYNRLGISTAQFTSSSGECSAIGMDNEGQAQNFYAVNAEKILRDIARGNGDYFISLTTFWECNQSVALEKIKVLRDSYVDLLNSNLDEQYTKIKKSVQCDDFKKS